MLGYNKKRDVLVLIIIMFFISAPLVYACVTPTDNLIIANDTTLCGGTYSLADPGNNGVLIITNSSLTLDCNSTQLMGDYSGVGIQLNGTPSSFVTNVILKGNCNIYNYSVGINVTYVHNSTISNILINTSDEADLNVVLSTNNLYENITLANATGDLLRLSDANHSIFRNISLVDFYRNATYTGLYAVNNQSNLTFTNILINVSSTAQPALGFTIQPVPATMYHLVDSIIANSTIETYSGATAGLGLGGDNVRVEYNTFLNNTRIIIGTGQIPSLGNNFTFKGNNFTSRTRMTDHSLDVYGITNLSIVNNIFTGDLAGIVTYAGIRLQNSNTVLIANNYFNTTAYGIVTINSNYMNITNNTFNNTTYKSIYLIRSENNSVNNNSINTVFIGGQTNSMGIVLDYVNNSLIANNSVNNASILFQANNSNNLYVADNNFSVAHDHSQGLLYLFNTFNSSFYRNALERSTDVGVVLISSANNTFVNNSLSNNNIGVSSFSSNSNFSNTILNSSGVTTNSSAGILYVQWFGLANVSFSNGTSGNGVNVTFSNQSSVLRSSAVAGSNNFTGLTVLTQYYESAGAKVYEAPIISNGSRGVSTAQSNFNITGSGQVVTLVLNAIPSVPIYDGPSNASTVSSTSASLSWQNSTDIDVQPISYIVEVSTSNSFAALTSFSVVSEGSSPTATTVSGLTNGVTYYWRVRASDGFGNSSTTAVRQFTIDTSVNPPPPSGSCFPAGTKILMADHTEKNIEDVRVGEKVLGFNGKEQVEETVLVLESPVRDHLYHLTFADGSQVSLTREHPLFTEDGWKALSPKETKEENPNLIVGSLRVGDKVLNVNNAFVRLARIDYLPGRVQTYNLKSVSENNNFFANNFLAHNKGGGGGCSDECVYAGLTECTSNSALRTCGDYDTDTCLEWGTTACAVGTVCDDGACVCAEHVVCGAWSECLGDVQERTCEDTNACRVGPFTEKRSCGSGLEIPGLLEEEGRSGFMQCLVTQGLSSREILNLEFLMKIDGCAPGYGVVDVERACGGYNVDVSGEALLSLLLDGPKPGVFVSFEPKDLGGPYCPYCFDGVQDFDEISVDCGGPSCPSCTEKPAYFVRPPLSIPLAMIIALVLSLVGIYFSGKYMKKVL